MTVEGAVKVRVEATDKDIREVMQRVFVCACHRTRGPLAVRMWGPYPRGRKAKQRPGRAGVFTGVDPETGARLAVFREPGGKLVLLVEHERRRPVKRTFERLVEVLLEAGVESAFDQIEIDDDGESIRGTVTGRGLGGRWRYAMAHGFVQIATLMVLTAVLLIVAALAATGIVKAPVVQLVSLVGAIVGALIAVVHVARRMGVVEWDD